MHTADLFTPLIDRDSKQNLFIFSEENIVLAHAFFFSSLKDILLIWRNIFTIKNILCNGNVLWMLKILQGTKDTYK